MRVGRRLLIAVNAAGTPPAGPPPSPGTTRRSGPP